MSGQTDRTCDGGIYPLDADLRITKALLDNMASGVSVRWEITVSNLGPDADPGPITVTDPLVGQLLYQAATGDGWTCNVVSQTVTCTHTGPLTPGTSLPKLVTTTPVAVGSEGTISNAAEVKACLSRGP